MEEALHSKRMTQRVSISQRHMLKLEAKGFPDGLDVEYDREV